MKVQRQELEANVGKYLEAVRRGESLIVMEGDAPLARVEPVVKVTSSERSLEALEHRPEVEPRHPIDLDRLLRESRLPW